MPLYNHDIMHCSREECKLKETCYRYWLKENFKDKGYQYASFYRPQEPVTDGCEYYLNIKNY